MLETRPVSPSFAAEMIGVDLARPADDPLVGVGPIGTEKRDQALPGLLAHPRCLHADSPRRSRGR